MTMSLQTKRDDAVEFAHAVLGFWVGIHAFRTFVPAAVWNLAEPLPLHLKGFIAIGVHLLGIAGCLLPFTRRSGSVTALAAAVAGAGVARQLLLGNDSIGALLALVAWLLWLWWLAAFARRIGGERARIVAPALAAAFALQVGLQAATFGLDLPMARGAVAVVCALLLNAAFAYSAFAGERAHTPVASGGSYVFLSLGAAFFLEVTLFANVGRAGFTSGWELAPAAWLIQAGLLAGLLLSTLSTPRALRFLYAAGLIGATLLLPQQGMAATAALVVGQISLLLLVAGAAESRTPSSTWPFVGGMSMMFVLLFLFYNWYEWPVLWVVGAAAVVLAGAWARSTTEPVPRRYAVAALAGLVITIVAAVPRTVPVPRQTTDTFRFLTYNIHQGYDAGGAPAMRAIAEEIERIDADVIVLQEAGRGWTLVGGADLVAYLKRRFPGYALHFVPVNGQLWGLAILSRLPLSDLATHVFDAAPGVFRYGLVQATVEFADLAVRVTGVHLSAGLEGNGGAAREDQTATLLRVAGTHAHSIVAGDFNAHPDEPPVERTLGAGFRDAGAAVGLAGIETWPAHAPNERIDYVFLKGSLQPAAGAIPRTTASDHLPVWIDIRVAR